MDASGAARRGRTISLSKYELVDEIGHGGMATVYRAHDARLGRDVAVKVIHPHLRDSSEVRHRFTVEAKAVAKLRHPNIVDVFDVSGEGDEEQYLVVELLGGSTLRDLLKRHGVVPPEVAASLAVELLGALAHAHAAGVVHRDVKPENVMLEYRPPTGGASSGAGPRDDGAGRDDDGGEDGSPAGAPPEPPGAAEGLVVKLTDFGIAKLLDAQGVTSTGQVLGSPAHMAPEQIEGQEVDERVDVFGMGVLLYESMVGHLPFEGSNPAQVLRRVLDGVYPDAERERSTIGVRWSRILDRALAHDPAARYPSANAMREALVVELRRVGVASPRDELARWLEAPERYGEGVAAGLVDRLCVLGAKARKRGDVLGAAADYNRALANRPDDPRLLRLVTTMQRRAERERRIRAAIPFVLVACTVASGAFWGGRALRVRSEGGSAVAAATTSTTGGRVAVAAPPGSSPAAPATATGASPGVDGGAALATDPRTTSALDGRPGDARPGGPRPPAVPAKPVRRDLVVGAVRPPFGVLLALDGEPPRSVESGTRLGIDGRAHVLKLTCVNDACEPQTRAVEAGEGDEALALAMTIRPATLVVDGDRALGYQIVEEPSILVRSGVPVEVPMRGSRSAIHVVELPSKRIREVALVAGREAHAPFVEGP